MTTTLTPPPIPAFRLGHPQTSPALRFGGTIPAEALTERHRPATLADMVGQGAAVWQLGSFLEAPSSRAFLFSGPTGVGKTTAARALAADLGVDPDWGLHTIRSAEADYAAVDDSLRMLRHTCPVGSGYKMVIIDEADLMTPKASHAWLSALEDLPPKSVVVFTTNAPDRFPDRFLDRCERIDFAADGGLLSLDAQALVDRIWLAELGRDDAPRVAEIPNVVDKHGLLSFRRCVAALDPMIRDHARRHAPTAAPSAPTVPFAAPARPDPPAVALVAPVAPAPSPAPPPASKRRPPKRPAPRPTATGPVPAPRPSATAPTPADVASLARVDGRLAELDAEYTRLGMVLLEMDRKRDALRKRRRELERKAKAARKRG